MDFKERNKKIKKERKKGTTYEKISKIHGITKERVRQICSGEKPPLYCKKHNKKYRGICPFCRIDEQYKKILNENGNLKDEIKKLKGKDRNEDLVRKRKILITKLHDEFYFSFRRIGQLLGRDHSTIMYNYYSFEKENKLLKKR